MLAVKMITPFNASAIRQFGLGAPIAMLVVARPISCRASDFVRGFGVVEHL